MGNDSRSLERHNEIMVLASLDDEQVVTLSTLNMELYIMASITSLEMMIREL